MLEKDYKYYAEKVKKVDEAIAPICKVFGITDYGYEVTERPSGEISELLVLNGQKIGCTCNSVSAVVDELLGYIFITRYCRNRSLGAFEKQTKNCIMRYWIKR